MRVHDFFESKIKGADGKACWKGYRYNGTKDGKDSCVKVDEARADINFDAEDLKRLERINDLETLKTQAFGLISKPSAKPMKPEKVAWFKQALAGKSNKIAVIKMMYDLMLSGEGNSVIGSKNSINPNSYRKVFNSATPGVVEGAEFGSNYAEQLAQQTFDIKSDLKDENEVLNLGYSIAKRELGSRANGVFRDEDFPSDFVSAYFYLQKQGVAEGVPGETLESELERLKMRQDAEHGSAPLKRQVETQARIRELEKQIKNKKQGVAEGFKNTYEVNDRVDTPLGSGTIVAVSPNVNVDGKVKIKLDDPSQAGEDGKHKDTFVLNTNMLRHITENAEQLNIGDDVIVTGNVEFKGKTGVIDDFGKDKRFVVVNLYNHGKHSFHSSDISINDYAGSSEEESRMSEAYQNDESNLWYIYDKTDGRLKQKMIDNLDEPRARSMGYRDSMDGALRVANIIRSKFDPKKYVQKQGNQWVPVYPFGKPSISEAESAEQMTPNWAKYVLDQVYNSDGAVTMTDLFDEGIPGLRDMFMATAQELGLDPDEDFQEIESAVLEQLEDLIKGGHGMDEAFSSPLPIKDMLASMYHPKVGDKIRTRKGGQIPGTVEKVAELNGIDYCWFRHPEGKLYKTPCSNVMRG